jgi:peptidoglycan hydrolase CwlO-like protein
MKKKFHYLAFLSLIISFSLTSCVSTKKFKASEARVSELQNDNANIQNRLAECNTKKLHF